MFQCPLAHNIDAQRMVRDLRRNVDGARHLLQHVEEVREALPVPFQAFGQRDAGNILHALHQIDQRLVMLLADRGEADAAIAEQDGGGAVPGRRREHRVPGRLAVVMGVDVDPAGGDEMAGGVDVAPGRAGLAADRDDPVTVDRHVADKGRTASSVHDGPAADDNVMHRVNAPSDEFGMSVPSARHACCYLPPIAPRAQADIFPLVDMNTR